MDSYQAVRDAAQQAFDISYVTQAATEAIHEVSREMTKPSVLMKPDLRKDGNAWIALYGENLAIGVVGCGETPAQAMDDFDVAWYKASGSSAN
jgi:hypothetical protein